MIRIIVLFFITLFTTVGFAETQQPLQSEQAFQFSTSINDKNQLLLQWRIAPDYYLYRHKIKINLVPTSQVKIEPIKLPPGKTKKDEINGVYQVYSGSLVIPVTPQHNMSGILNLGVDFQGCSAKGFCYAPVHKDVRVTLSANKNNVVVTSVMPTATCSSEQSYAESLLCNSNYLVIVLSFLGLGLLLAFTPCILPMIPILSSIIVGQGKNITPLKSFLLSFFYVLGMALTYAAAGVVVAIIGSGIQVLFQKTWVIVLFSLLFVLLALSLFGYYELQLPSKWQRRVTALSNRQRGGTYIGVFLMGALSSLIVSPCVSAPLVGVLAYIAQTGNMVLGGVALLSMGFGMGVPLLLIGLSAGKLLPRAGAWMETIKKLFGILLLAVAIWLLSRVVPGPFTLTLWATWLISIAMLLGKISNSKKWKNLFRGLGGIFVIYGIILITGAVTGNSDPLHPWEKMAIMQPKNQHDVSFVIISSMKQLDHELEQAKKKRVPVILDYYADWCTACIDMDRHVFKKATVQNTLTDIVLLRADVTKNNDFDQAILKRFNVIAPPTVLFFADNGTEIHTDRIVGEVNADKFVQHVEQMNLVSK